MHTKQLRSDQVALLYNRCHRICVITRILSIWWFQYKKNSIEELMSRNYRLSLKITNRNFATLELLLLILITNNLTLYTSVTAQRVNTLLITRPVTKQRGDMQPKLNYMFKIKYLSTLRETKLLTDYSKQVYLSARAHTHTHTHARTCAR